MTKYSLGHTPPPRGQVVLTSYVTGSPEVSADVTLNACCCRRRDIGCCQNCPFVADGVDGCGCDRLKNVSENHSYGGVYISERKNDSGSCCECAYKAKTAADHGVFAISVPDKQMGSSSTYGQTVSKSTLRKRVKTRLKNLCSKKMLSRRIPIIQWLPNYTIRAAISDMIAGVTVGLTVIPQAIAYANVAGLPPQYGLYSSFMACFVYTVFGSCKDSPVGPTAIAAILTRENIHGFGPEYAVLLCFLSGCVEFLMGALQLGFLIDFISGPVSVGFTSAAAIIIATTQVKAILGLSFPGGKFLEVWGGLYTHFSEIRIWDTCMGISCIVILLLLRKVKDIPIGSKKTLTDAKTKWSSRATHALWFLSTTRNILVVIFCAGLAYYFEQKNLKPFVLTGTVKPGVPPLEPPQFSNTVGNTTYNFLDMAETLSSSILVVPLLSILEDVALAKVFSEDGTVDATQEMLALGLCNIASSFVSSMPVSGALSRGAVNHASGVHTTAGGLYTGALVLLSLQFFTPYFYYIPKASLAAVIIAAVVFMVEIHLIKPIWKTKKLDIIPALLTFLSCLLVRLELGIVIGVVVNLMFLLYASARPSVKIYEASSANGIPHIVAEVDRSLSFASAEYVRKYLKKAAEKLGTNTGGQRPLPLVLDASHVQAIDFTAAKGLQTLMDDLEKRDQKLILLKAKASTVRIITNVNKQRPIPQAKDLEQLEHILINLAQTINTIPDVANGI